jgi:parvulin-like peptidyl-prolyl isomerase
MRVNIDEIFVRAESLAVSIYERIRKGEDFGALAAQYTERPGFKEKRGEWGFIPIRTNDLSEIAVSMKTDSVTLPLSFESGWSIIKKLGRKLIEDKTFEEALPEVTSQYRDFATKLREQQWIDSLTKKYSVQVHEDVLQEAFKRKKSD